MNQPYPTGRAGKCWAQKFSRLVFKACVANVIGQDAALLLLAVAATEDAKWYTGAVTFHNGQLLPILGFKKWERLDCARQRAVDAGWLHYEAPAPGRREPGRYWVTVSTEAAGLSDAPLDESSDPVNAANHIPQTDTVGGNDRQKRIPLADTDRDTVGGNLLPIPVPKRESARAAKRGGTPAPKFVPPTLEEVEAYCKERNNRIDAKRFIEKHNANGWRVGRNPMKDWRATIRNWETYEKPATNGQTTSRYAPLSGEIPKPQPRRAAK